MTEWEDLAETKPLRVSSVDNTGVRAIGMQQAVMTYDEHRGLLLVDTVSNGLVEINCLGVPYSYLGINSPEVNAMMRKFFQDVADSCGFAL